MQDTLHHDVNLPSVENVRRKSVQLSFYSKIFKTKQIIQQKAILENLLDINEQQISLVYSFP